MRRTRKRGKGEREEVRICGGRKERRIGKEVMEREGGKDKERRRGRGNGRVKGKNVMIKMRKSNRREEERKQIHGEEGKISFKKSDKNGKKTKERNQKIKIREKLI